MKENIFQGQLSHSINKFYVDNKIPYFYHKFPDTASKEGASGKKPYDCILCVQGMTIGMELKSTLELKSFSVDKVQGHQIYNLLKIKEIGGNAWIIIYVTEYNKCAVFDVENWVEKSKQFLASQSKKSISNKMLLMLCDFTITKEMAYGWNFLRLTYPKNTSLEF